ncbi:MAG: hypothetical protein DRO88_06070 [Promethearchaeia archaeon]|nr:MAG: hypothetical protein DRO88_06070 [Candidatus Lokiarchaeia archaeon]
MVKLNWFRGKSFGLALIYFGVMGLYQLIFMLLAQYGLQIGSRPIIILIPLGVIFATAYSVIILFETNITKIHNLQKKHYKSKKKKTRKKMAKTAFISTISLLWKNPYIRPVFLTMVVFGITFGISYGVCSILVDEKSTLFVLADNIAAFGALLFATYFDKT